MELIIGGAYQGKRAFAVNTLGIPETDIFTCSGTEIDFSMKCIDKLEEFVLACIRAGEDPLENLKGQNLEDKVIICMDMFCGVVPIDGEMRLWRHTTGLVCQYLAGKATGIHRMFCGLEQRLK